MVWLERWTPLAHIKPDDRLRMTFLHAEVLDIRARAQQLGKLLSLEEEGAVVEHWIENCSMQKEPSRLALGRYLKQLWQRELERQKAIKQSSLTLLTNGSRLVQTYLTLTGSVVMRDLWALRCMFFPSGIRIIGSSMASWLRWKPPLPSLR